MMRRIYILCLAGMVLACGEKLIKPPEDLIPREKMIDILYDISIIDAVDNTYPNALEDNDLQVMPFIYDKYGIDSAQFVQSDLYYASQPNQYREIYQTLFDRLQAQRDSINATIQKGRGDIPEEDRD